jgi:hypothetical protein
MTEGQRIKAMLAALLENLSEVLRENGAYESLCAVTIYPGTMVPYDFAVDSDNECTGGQAWVRLLTSFPTKDYPTPDTRLSNCSAELGLMLEVGIVRPAAVMEQFATEVSIPTPEQEFDLSMALIDDMVWMKEAVARTKADYSDLILGAWTPYGPDGGAVGGTWTVTATADKS